MESHVKENYVQNSFRSMDGNIDNPSCIARQDYR